MNATPTPASPGWYLHSPPQEEGNIPYVVDNRVGAFETRPDRIAAIMDSWLLKGGRHWFEDMGKRAKALGRPEVRRGGGVRPACSNLKETPRAWKGCGVLWGLAQSTARHPHATPHRAAPRRAAPHAPTCPHTLAVLSYCRVCRTTQAVYRIVDDLAALTEEPYFDFGPATAALLGAEGAKKRKSWRPHKHPHGHPHGNGPMLAPAPA